MKEVDLLSLLLNFMLLAMISFGGANTVLPEMQRYVVEVNGWMTARQFAELFALGQAAPGPNIMYVALLGLQIAGWKGALITAFGTLVPPACIAYGVTRLSARNPGSRFGRAVRTGLSPVTIGLTFATGWILLDGRSQDWVVYAIAAATLVLVLRTRVNPLWLIAGGALAGIVGLT